MVRALLFLAIGGFATSCASSPRPIEDAIARTAANGPPGAITVVEFVDYKCDFCKSMNDVLAPLLE